MHAVLERDRPCPHCGEDAKLAPLGERRRTTEYDFVPGYFRRRVHAQEVRAGSCGQHVVTALPPALVYDRCQYGAGFIAHLVTSKCADSMPLHRLEKAYARLGIPVRLSPMHEVFHRSAEILRPIYDRLLESIGTEHVVLTDETQLLMQTQRRRGYVWTFRTDRRIAYVSAEGRSGATPSRVLEGKSGVLLVDGYTGYNAVVSVDCRKRAACLAHVRGELVEALGSAPELGQEALDHILALYRV